MVKIWLCCLVTWFGMMSAQLTVAQTATKDVMPAARIIKSVETLLNYHANYLQLKEAFTAYDAEMQKVSKEAFLKKLTTGDFLPLRMYAQNKHGVYRLYRLPKGTDPDIKAMLKQIGNTYYGFALIVGKKFPPFHFEDMNGNIYTPANTKGKIVVLKAWFVSCAPCVAEMPALNKVKASYNNRKDILFLSIAFDSKKRLQQFLKRTTFNYAVIPVSAQYIENELHATGYPAHWVINKQGIVVDMSYDYEEMVAALKKEAAKG